MVLVVIGTFWVACGIIAYKNTFMYFQKGWPTLANGDEMQDRFISFVTAFMGPMGLLASLVACGCFKHGFKW